VTTTLIRPRPIFVFPETQPRKCVPIRLNEMKWREIDNAAQESSRRPPEASSGRVLRSAAARPGFRLRGRIGEMPHQLTEFLLQPNGEM
jgi:hypothetical protein